MKISYWFISAGLVTTVACSKDTARTTSPTASAPPAATTQATADTHRMVDLTAFVDPGADTFKRPVGEVIAVLHSTTGSRMGSVRLVERGYDGLDVFATIEGLPAGTHAYHIHVFGDCSAPDAKSAGPHFHFTGSSFNKNVNMITGNLGELTPDAEGRAAHQTRLPFARIHGPYSVIGRSIVIHERGNDPSAPPDGAAGGRIACGVIGIADPSPPDGPTVQR